MAGQQPPSGYGYGAPPSQPYGSSQYGAPPPSTQSPYAPVATPYGAPSAPYGAPSGPYGAQSAPHGYPGEKPPKTKYDMGGAPPSHGQGGYPPAPAYGSPFASLVPSTFPPGTDPNIVACFQVADQDGSGLIDDKELQRALSSYNQSFNLRTVHLLMYTFTNTNTRKIGTKLAGLAKPSRPYQENHFHCYW